MTRKKTHPPLPRLVLRLGVTGHRTNRFPAHAQTVVRHKLEVLLADFSRAVSAQQESEAEFFAPEPPQIRIVSALAEGADRVVAEAGLNAGFPLDVVLPFPADVYESDFSTAESKQQFHAMLSAARARFVLPGGKADRSEAERAYEAAGLITLRQCDVLIAVWDGREASGRGGTQDVVQRAVENGRPVLHFDTEGNGPFLLVGSAPSDARDLAARGSKPVEAAIVSEIVGRLCAPPGPSGSEPSRARLRRFLQERERRLVLSAWYPLLVTSLSDKKGFWRSFHKPAYRPAVQTEWKAYSDELARAGPALSTPLQDVVLTRFAWADKLADHYGQLHRSGYVTNFILAAFAVLFAGLGQHWSQWAEFTAILLIGLSTYRGQRYRWHQRWLDYRQLSAQLRQLRALLPTGSSPWEARTPHMDEDLEPGPLWVNWYYRLTLREAGLLDVTVDEKYLAIVRSAIGQHELKGQIAYHEANARQMHKIGRRLESLSTAAFGITFLICAFEVAGLMWPIGLHAVGEGLGALSVVLPAFGGALFGIRVHGDFEGSARRSHGMAQRLSRIAERLDDDDAMSFAELSALTEQATDIMTSEVGDWSYVFRARPLSLPT